MARRGAFHRLVFHFNWATRNRAPTLTPGVEARLIPYIKAKCRELGYTLHAVNGTETHLHVLVSLPPTILIADVARMLKGSSSHYINRESGDDGAVYWQDGYGVVSVRERDIPAIAEYIRRQEEHHRSGTLIEELERVEE